MDDIVNWLMNCLLPRFSCPTFNSLNLTIELISKLIVVFHLIYEVFIVFRIKSWNISIWLLRSKRVKKSLKYKKKSQFSRFETNRLPHRTKKNHKVMIFIFQNWIFLVYWYASYKNTLSVVVSFDCIIKNKYTVKIFENRYPNWCKTFDKYVFVVNIVWMTY